MNQRCDPLIDPNKMALFDKIPSYDRKYVKTLKFSIILTFSSPSKHFYDTITTSAAMRQVPRLCASSLGQSPNNMKNYNQAYVRKGNSCANERYNSNARMMYNYYPGNDQQHPLNGKSNEPANNNGKRTDSSEKLSNEAEDETPEWYTNPATVDDFIDLHGFDDFESETQAEPKIPQSANEKGYGTPSLAYRRSSYNQSRHVRGGNANGGYNQYNGYNNQRFRNPLHSIKRKLCRKSFR